MIKGTVKKIVIICMALLCAGLLHAQESVKTDSLKLEVHFRLDYHDVDPSFRNNRDVLDSLSYIIYEAQRKDLFRSVEVKAFASPEGGQQHNDRLASSRADALASWIAGNCNVPFGDIVRKSGGVGWELLRSKVAESDAVYRDDVLDILDHMPVWTVDNNGNVKGSLKNSLMNLDGGSVWNDMSRRFFPDIRCCVAVVVNTVETCEVAEDTVSLVYVPADTPDSINISAVPAIPAVPAEAATDTLQFQADTIQATPSSILAFKTNLLADAVLIPNIGIEFYLGEGWSIAANWHYAWWHSDRIHWYWRTYGGDLTVRKYFGNREKNRLLRGHHLGLYGQIHTYDFELGGKGIMGGIPGGTIFDKFHYGGGIEYGYSHPISKRLNIDFALGLGYIVGEYREYIPVDQCYVWQATKNRHYFGPTKAEISLVWLMGGEVKNDRKGGK